MALRSMPPRSFPMARSFRALSGLRTLLVSHQDDFVRTLAEKLLSYAIGRVSSHHDLPAIRKIARECGGAELPVVGSRHGDCQEHAVHHGDRPG